MCIYAYIHVYICMYVCMYACMYVCIDIYLYTCSPPPPPHDPRFCLEIDGSWQESGL